MAAVVVVRAVSLRRVNVVVRPGVMERPRPRVVREQRIAFRESLLGLQLHRVEVVARIRAVVAEVLRPAELVEERLALVGGQRGIANQRRLVEIVIAAEAGEDVRAFGADVSGFDRDVADGLALHGHVPAIGRRQAQAFRQDERRHAVRQDRAAIRAFGLPVENRLRIERLRSLRQIEDRVEIARRLIRLNAEHRQVLRHVVPEDRAEDARVEPAAKSQAQHGLFRQLVGDADARREEIVGRLLIQIEAHALRTGDSHFASLHVYETALARAGHGLRTIVLVTQSVVERQLAIDAPVVLQVGEVAVLPLFGVGDCADVALEVADIAQQERSQRRTAAARPLRARRVELQFARAMPVGGDAQVQRAAVIETEAQRVIADFFRPVVDKLELPLVLAQRTIATGKLQRVAEVELVARIAARPVAVEQKRRHAARERIIVQSGNARVFGRRGIARARINVHAIAEPAEAEVGAQGVAHRIIEARGDALVARARDAGERRLFVKAAPARRETEDAGTVQPVIGQTVTTEELQLLAVEIIPAGVGQIFVEFDRARADVIRRVAQHTADVRQRNELQQVLRLRAQARRRNHVAGELPARGRSVAAGRIEDVHAQPAQIARALRRRRHAQQGRTARVAPRALVIAEPEELVPDEPAAGRAAELVVLRHRNEAIRAANLLKLREGIARVERAIAQEFKADRVEIVRARFGLHADDARRRPEFGVVGRRRDLRLRQRFERRIDDHQ